VGTIRRTGSGLHPPGHVTKIERKVALAPKLSPHSLAFPTQYLRVFEHLSNEVLVP